MLGERVGARRWLAVLVGLCGVVVMMRPGEGFVQLAVLLPVGAAVTYSLTQILTRRLGATDRASAIALYTQLSFLAVSVVFGLALGDGRYAGTGDPSLEFLLREWRWPTPFDAGLMVFAGLLIAVGAYLLVQAYRLAPVSVVAPFEYSALPWGVLFGYLLWGHLPDGAGLAGLLLIVGSGLYVLYREHLKGARRAPGLTARSLR